MMNKSDEWLKEINDIVRSTIGSMKGRGFKIIQTYSISDTTTFHIEFQPCNTDGKFWDIILEIQIKFSQKLSCMIDNSEITNRYYIGNETYCNGYLFMQRIWEILDELKQGQFNSFQAMGDKNMKKLIVIKDQTIGQFFDTPQDIEGMSRVGYSGSFEVYVNTDDGGKIPHFHMRDPKDWKAFHTCIELEHAKYFLHNGKEDMLNSQQRKQLQEFMSGSVQQNKYSNKFENNWELACFLWDINNSDVTIDANTSMPNYRNLNN